MFAESCGAGCGSGMRGMRLKWKLNRLALWPHIKSTTLCDLLFRGNGTTLTTDEMGENAFTNLFAATKSRLYLLECRCEIDWKLCGRRTTADTIVLINLPPKCYCSTESAQWRNKITHKTNTSKSILASNFGHAIRLVPFRGVHTVCVCVLQFSIVSRIF